MKITKVIGYGLSSPVKGGHTYYGYQSDVKNIGIIEVHTDSDIIGFGETYAGVYCAELIGPIVNYLQKYMVGLNINDDNSISVNPYIGRSGLIKCVYSGIEIAIYDALAKHIKVPLYKFLGGKDRKIPVYASNGSAKFTHEQIADDVKNILDLGYTSYKMRIGLQSKKKDLKRLETAKKYLGDYNLMVDAIMGTNPNKWKYYEALEWSRDLEQFDVYWLEEPFEPTQMGNYNMLKLDSNVKIAGGEALNQLFEFDLYRSAVDIIQPDVTNSGGIKDCSYIVNKFGKENVAMHVWGSQVAINANKHFAKAYNVGFLEIPMMELEINDDIVGGEYGIGINITSEVKEKYKLKHMKDFSV